MECQISRRNELDSRNDHKMILGYGPMLFTHRLYLLGVCYAELSWRIEEVPSICLGWNPLHSWGLYIVVPTLLLGKMNGVLCCVELHPQGLNVIRTASPAHQGILPSSTSLKSIEIYPPFRAFCTTRLHRVSSRYVDPNCTVLQLLGSTTYNLSSEDFFMLSNGDFVGRRRIGSCLCQGMRQSSSS